MKNESEILRMYVSSDERMPLIQEPFSYDDYIFATNTFIMIRVNKILCDGEYEPLKAKIEPFKVLPPTDYDNFRVFPISIFQDAIDKVPIVEYRPTCEDCGGEGYVDYGFTSAMGRRYFVNDICPVCDGVGHLCGTGKMVKDESCRLLWGNVMFDWRWLEIIIKTAKLRGRDTVEVLNIPDSERPYNPILFDLGTEYDGSEVRVAVMPVGLLDKEKTTKAIKINAPYYE